MAKENTSSLFQQIKRLFVLDDKESATLPATTEQRGVPLSDWNALQRLFPHLAISPNVTTETILGISALWRAIDLISSAVAGLPVQVYRRDRGKITVMDDHRAAVLCNVRPNDEQTPFMFWRSLIANAILRGGGGAQIVRDRYTGHPIALRLMRYGCTPYKVSKNDPLYYYDNEDGEMYFPDDVLYIPGIMVTDGQKARSLAETFAAEFGAELASAILSKNIVSNGAFLSGHIEQDVNAPRLKSDEGKAALEEDWRRKYSGIEAAGDIAILNAGMKYVQHKPMNLQEAGFEGMRKFNVSTVARITGVPAVMLQETEKQSYNFSETANKNFFQFCLDPWITKRDQELGAKLLAASERGRVKVETLVDEIMWMTPKDRADYWNKLFQMGAKSPNEIRAYNNDNPVEGGDEMFVQLNLVPLSGAKNAMSNERKRKKKDYRQPELFENEKPSGSPADG